jgi:hypothetical protein
MIQPQLIRVNEHKQICCDKNTPSVPNENNSNNKKITLLNRIIRRISRQKTANSSGTRLFTQVENGHSKKLEKLDR